MPGWTWNLVELASEWPVLGGAWKNWPVDVSLAVMVRWTVIWPSRVSGGFRLKWGSVLVGV